MSADLIARAPHRSGRPSCDLPSAALPRRRRRHSASGVRTAPGVFGHIELPGDDHWDPGGFDYPEFFGMVRDVLGGDEDMRMDELIKGHQAYRDKFKSRGEDPGPPPRTDPMISRKGGDRRVWWPITRSPFSPRVAEAPIDFIEMFGGLFPRCDLDPRRTRGSRARV